MNLVSLASRYRMPLVALALVLGLSASHAADTAPEGQLSARITISRITGKPFSNQPFSIRAYDSKTHILDVIKTGQLDDAGQAEVVGIPKPGENTSLYVGAGTPNTDVGKLTFSEGEIHANVAFTLPPFTGDPAPDISLQHVFSGKTVKLSDYKGQVVFLDFWATWCGPCQVPMAHNNDLLEKYGDTWKDRAAILAVSIDDTVETVRGHVEKNGWTNVTHLWATEGGVGPESDAWKTYGLTGVPTTLVISADGIVAWRGYPSSNEAETLITRALSGEALSTP